MRTELISIETDTHPLDGAWYEPESGVTAGAVMLCHGNTMNFYVGAPRFLPPMLTELGFACLAFNRRGHDILSIRDSRAAEGAAFQTTAQGIADNEFAAGWLRERGFPVPVVIGHSNGGFLGVQHVARHPETPALVLLSAHAGPATASALARRTGHLGGDRTDELKALAEQMVADGRGAELMLLPGWWYVSTAESYLDRLTTMPETVATAPRISCPVLFVRGDQEMRDAYPAEEFAAASAGPCDVEIVSDCDHFSEFFDEETGEEEIPDEIGGYPVRGIEDGYVIGGEIIKNEEYGEVQFADLEAAEVQECLAGVEWNTDQVFSLIRTAIKF